MTVKDTQTQSKILVIDDHPENLTLLTRYLGEEGFTVLPVKDGLTAFKVLEIQIPDLILLDIAMPGMDGFEVCRRLKENEKTKDIPVIFITGLTEMAHKLKGFEVGGIDYIAKPVQREEVLARVFAHVSNRKLQQQLQEEKTRFQVLSEATFEGIIIHEENEILEVNQAMVILTGYQRDELIGMNVLKLLTPDAQETFLYWIRSGNKQPFEVQGIKSDRTIFPIELHLRTLSWHGREVMMTAVRDITWGKLLEQENRFLRITLDDRDHFGQMVGQSPAMKKMYDRVISAAASDNTVIIYGETGTGKELVARTIFQLSERHTKTFVPVNCAALQDTLFEAQFFGYRKGAFTGALRDTPGYFDQAQGGTLFLDEVGELTIPMQAKLLRVLEDRTYTPVGATTSRAADVRIIAATNKELRQLMYEGKIRDDFFHRLHVIALEIPPLRWRKEDIPLLITHFLARYASSGKEPPTISPDLIEQFYAYDWPGNVRELFNELRRYFTTGEVELTKYHLAETPEVKDLPFLQDGLSLNQAVEAFEQYYIERVLQKYDGHKIRAAKALKVGRKTLYNKLKKYEKS